MKLVFVKHPGTESYRHPIRFELPANFRVGRSKLGVPGHIHPEVKVND